MSSQLKWIMRFKIVSVTIDPILSDHYIGNEDKIQYVSEDFFAAFPTVHQVLLCVCACVYVYRWEDPS